jgi:nitrogen fixation protein FixH
MKRFLEKGYGWPAFVVLLLLSSVVMMGLVVMAARSDGGAQVVSDYYEQAVRWDSLASVRDAASARGWTAQLDLERSGNEFEGRITVRDSSGTALSFEGARITVSRPQYAEAQSTFDAVPMEGSPVLAFRSSLQGSGLWDIQALVDDAGGPVLFSWRREL